MQILIHPAFLSVAASWLLAGLFKFGIARVQKKKNLSLVDELMRTGGMPSSHSATVIALTTMVFFIEGISLLFVTVLVLSLVVIRDSYGMRWSVGEQAKMVNMLLRKEKVEKKVKVILGHTPSQVNAGIVLGIVVSILVHFFVV
jgi:acid phosphatase family membrane protein YuiD